MLLFKHKGFPMTILRRLVLTFIILLLILFGALLAYLSVYYHATEEAEAALKSDERVYVSETDYGWFFDGPSDRDALIFYPGAKVEETAYAPLLHQLADKGLDVCLVKMPLRFALLGKNQADGVMQQYNYENWYLGGHSLGGAAAAFYLADATESAGDAVAGGPANRPGVRGIIFLASYSTEPLDEHLRALTIYGTEDRVLNMQKLKDGRKCLPPDSVTYVIEGGNHAQFGNYGPQKNDGTATISLRVQQDETCESILSFVRGR